MPWFLTIQFVLLKYVLVDRFLYVFSLVLAPSTFRFSLLKTLSRFNAAWSPINFLGIRDNPSYISAIPKFGIRGNGEHILFVYTIFPMHLAWLLAF